MGRPFESPWTVRWTDAIKAPALFHGDDHLFSCHPVRMTAVLHGLGRLTSDADHVLRWAAWIEDRIFSTANEDTLASLLVRVPGCWRLLRFSSVAGMDPPPPADLLSGVPRSEAEAGEGFLTWCAAS